MKEQKLTLTDLFIASFRYIAKCDSKSDNKIDTIKNENDTYQFRTIEVFVTIASYYYSSEEIEAWVKNNLIDEFRLPKF